MALGPLERLKASLRDDWCKNCGRTMNHPHKRLFAIPGMKVGNYESHTDIDYYRRALWPVERREDIPALAAKCKRNPDGTIGRAWPVTVAEAEEIYRIADR